MISWNHRGVGRSARPEDESAGRRGRLRRGRRRGARRRRRSTSAWWPAGRSASTPPSSWPCSTPSGSAASSRWPGCPGGTFASMGAPLFIPRLLRRADRRQRRPADEAHRPGAHPGGPPDPDGADLDHGAAAQRLHVPRRPSQGRPAGGAGVPHHAGRLVRPPGRARPPGTAGCRCRRSTCRRRSSPAGGTSWPPTTTCAAPRTGSTTRPTSSSSGRHFIILEKPKAVTRLLHDLVDRSLEAPAPAPSDADPHPEASTRRSAGRGVTRAGPRRHPCGSDAAGGRGTRRAPPRAAPARPGRAAR